jgi:hypothetical protein
MSITLKASSKPSDAPDIEDNTYVADWTGVQLVAHPDWAGTNQWGKEDNGDRFHWSFDVFDDGDVVRLDALTNTNLNTGSKTVPTAVQYLKALLTKEEFAKFDEGGGIDADSIVPRRCSVQVGHSKSGYPQVVDVMPVPKGSGRKAAG